MNSRSTNSAAMALGLVLCFWAMWTSGKAGYARMLSNEVRRGQASVVSGTQAIDLCPNDPKGYYVRGRALLNSGQVAEAERDFQSAVRLRPDDHLSWLQLGYARERLGDREGALAAYREGVRLAPFYGQPRWYLAKLLLRMGDRDQGFTELRRAAVTDPKLLHGIIDLAWKEFDGDAQAVSQAIQPESSQARLELARFFAKHGKATEAIKLYRGSRDISNEDRRSLLSGLLAAKRFAEAYEVWADGQNANGVNRLINGDFESDIRLDDKGFGWQPADVRNVRISLDTREHQTGAFSLRLDWSGTSDHSSSVISQMILCEPETRYRLTFAARSQELLTIGLPIVTVSDAGIEDGSVLAESKPFMRGTSSWQDYTVEFTTGRTTTAVLVAIRREKCATEPCAILGQVWVDNFLLEKL